MVLLIIIDGMHRRMVLHSLIVCWTCNREIDAIAAFIGSSGRERNQINNMENTICAVWAPFHFLLGLCLACNRIKYSVCSTSGRRRRVCVCLMVSHFNYWSIVIAGTLRAKSAVLWVGGARLVPVRNSFACAALTRIGERFSSLGLLYTITTPSPRFCISRGSLLVH